MGIGLYWGNDEQSILLLEIDGAWTWDELHQTVAKVKALSADSPHDIAGILDVSAGLHIPGGTVFNRDGWNNALKLIHIVRGDTAGALVIVGANPALKGIYDAFIKLDRNMVSTVHFACDIDEAYDILERRVTPPLKSVVRYWNGSQNLTPPPNPLPVPRDAFGYIRRGGMEPPRRALGQSPSGGFLPSDSGFEPETTARIQYRTSLKSPPREQRGDLKPLTLGKGFDFFAADVQKSVPTAPP